MLRLLAKIHAKQKSLADEKKKAVKAQKKEAVRGLRF